MKRLQLIGLFIACSLLIAKAQGLPFFKTYTPSEYHGHKQNFDVDIDENGVVYVANFEGMLYYDNDQWRMMYSPNTTRITVIFQDSKGKMWVGGYQFFGYVKADKEGKLMLQTQDIKHQFHGEVQDIWEERGQIYFLVSNGKIYTAKRDQVFLTEKTGGSPYDYKTSIPNINVNWKESLDDGMTAIATDGSGLYIVDKNENILYHLTEERGLCSNNITSVSYNGHGLLWCVTDNGIFVVQVPSSYSRFTPNEGLRGEVLTLEMMGGKVYAGTLNGVFRQNKQSFEQIETISHACWQLIKQGDGLLAATSNGVYRIDVNGKTTHLTTANSTSIIIEGNGFYSGEMDGVYYHEPGKASQKVSDTERVIKFLKDNNGVIWFQNLHGVIGNNQNGTFSLLDRGVDHEVATLIMYNQRPTVISTNATEPIPYPLFSYTDQDGVLWATNSKGRGIYALVDNNKNNKWSALVYPLMDYNIRTVLHDNKIIWMGGSQGLCIVDASHKDHNKDVETKLSFRSIVVSGDSMVWGGYMELPPMMTFEVDERQILISYSTNFPSLLLPTQYRYRINGGRWSNWDYETSTEYNNQPPGRYVFEVQARDAYGKVIGPIAFRFEVKSPLYRRWYMILAYVVFLSLLGYIAIRWRISQLRKEQTKLERIIRERTAEVVKQKDEIEVKSKSLENALYELEETQHQLVRQEKMATVGKLTQGLIDRILNPLNYINNFSKLSEELVNDVKQNIEDEKDHMDSENYEDTIDILGMLKGNLQKVGEHGANTTRTLKAMEEMLKDRTGGIVKMDIIPLLHQNEEMLQTYFKEDISEYHININFNLPDETITIDGNADQLSKSFMSILGNAIYAVVKKAQRNPYSPEISLNLSKENDMIKILIHDNGIGIEDAIIHKIFDPFFTTKTTSEASGIGLYLTREIIQNHGGDIAVNSIKDKSTEFTILLPIAKIADDYGETN